VRPPNGGRTHQQGARDGADGLLPILVAPSLRLLWRERRIGEERSAGARVPLYPSSGFVRTGKPCSHRISWTVNDGWTEERPAGCGLARGENFPGPGQGKGLAREHALA
jgi:hypothetical protein